MANAILAYGNLVDSATLSGGSWVSTLPLTNLQDRRLGKVARSASVATADAQFDMAWSSAKLLRVVALVNHNFTLTALYRIRLSNDPTFATSIADSGWRDVWPVVYPPGSVEWESPNFWTGKYTADDIEGYNPTLVYILPTSMNAKYIRVEIDDPDNAADYVQIGRPFAGEGWQPQQNFEHGWSLAWDTGTEVQEALSRAEYFNVRRARRVARLEFQGMDRDEALGRTFEIQRRVGISGEVVIIPDPDDTLHALRTQFMARIRMLSPIENPGWNSWKAPFEIQELL